MTELNCLLPQRIQRACECYHYTNTADEKDLLTLRRIEEINKENAYGDSGGARTRGLKRDRLA